jgi:hypothetical protein
MSGTWILYQTTNICNSKIYVGVHKLADTSRSTQYLGSGNRIRAAIRKYGKKNFQRETLAEFSCAEDAYAAEAKMVTKEFISREDTYNLCLGGMGCKGIPLTDAHKAKLSELAKNRKMSEKHKAAIIAANKGNKHTLGRKLTDEHKAKISAGGKGRIFTDEHKARISAGLVGTKNSLGRIMSEEHKNKLTSSNYIPVMIDEEYYISIDKASKIKEINYRTMYGRVKSDNPKWVKWRLATDAEKAAYASGALE